MARIKGTAVFAAAYIKLDKTLIHACADEDFVHGRLKREAGEAFCDRKLNTVAKEDSYGFEPIETISCPRCLQIISKLDV